jgi:hypothetical protein
MLHDTQKLIDFNELFKHMLKSISYSQPQKSHKYVEIITKASTKSTNKILLPTKNFLLKGRERKGKTLEEDKEK